MLCQSFCTNCGTRMPDLSLNRTHLIGIRVDHATLGHPDILQIGLFKLACTTFSAP